MHKLAAAIRDDWPTALDAALTRWREHRTVAWATLVTTIGRRVGDQPGEDDPRTAMRLAAELVASPTDPLLAERIAALQHPLAIAKATTVWAELTPAQQQALSWSLVMTPDASDEEARSWVRTLDDPDGRVEALWRSLIESPDDVERRLVLADALIERGDPRGEAIALQCRDDGRAQAAQLLEDRHHEMLGDTALLYSGPSFRGGLLASISVGTVTTPPWIWDADPDPRELCALHDVSPGYVTAPRYARFLAGLPRVPAWVRLERAHLEELRKLGASVPFRNVEFSLWPPPRDLVTELLAVAAYAPTLEGLAFRASHWPTIETCIEVAREVRERVPRLRRFLVGLVPGHGQDAAVEVDFVEVVDAPSARSAHWS